LIKKFNNRQKEKEKGEKEKEKREIITISSRKNKI
jgi:hypothetical protein